jgi:hypothetical protein
VYEVTIITSTTRICFAVVLWTYICSVDGTRRSVRHGFAKRDEMPDRFLCAWPSGDSERPLPRLCLP